MNVLRYVLLWGIVILSLTGGALYLKRSQTSGAHPSGEEFAVENLRRLNEIRRLGQLNALVRDPEIETCLQTLDPKAAESSSILDGVRDLPGLSAVSAGIFYAADLQSLREELESWHDISMPDRTHFASRLFTPLGGRGIGCMAVLAEKPPLFEVEALTEKGGLFHHVCLLCDHPYFSRTYDVRRVLLQKCPSCEREYDILAMDTNRRYARANEYFSGIQPPATFPTDITEEKKMYFIWKAVLGHCLYKGDSDDPKAVDDLWQTSRETYEKRSGDCEDSAILLADWLTSSGIEARVVLGESGALAGHAWCVARVDGVDYLLETTMDETDRSEVPTVDEVGRDYRPKYLIDRNSLYFPRNTHVSPFDYWSEDAWSRVSYPRDVAS